jgi:hypothetical protein
LVEIRAADGLIIGEARGEVFAEEVAEVGVRSDRASPMV